MFSEQQDTNLKVDINKNIEIFRNGLGKNKGRRPYERYASFDYCFNYFQTFKDKNEVRKLKDKNNIQTSCLHLSFYLASWGMLRGSSFLLEKSAKHFEGLIHEIATFNEDVWKIDIDNYETSIDLLLLFKERVSIALNSGKPVSDTLTTKIMLGVFGNVPAYDNYFRKAFKIHTLCKKSLIEISDFYKQNKHTIDSYKIRTFDFHTGKETKRIYTKAKIIDMIGFIEGLKNNK